jgi:amino acid transporter
LKIPERFRYRMKNRLLGPPLVNEQLEDERLSRPIALGVLAPDCISSSAYGTEEMLNQLLPYIGLAAFTLLVPITLAILGVLFFVTLSYLEVIQVYTKAGGSYVVARENFGPNIAQIAAVALLIDYTVTVAVQTAAGTDALTSAFPSLLHLPGGADAVATVISVAVVLLLLYGNLRGIREAGRWFAIPTYFFVFSLGSIVLVGLVREVLGQLKVHSVHHSGVIPIGHPGNGLLLGASMFVVLKSFANGGSSLTGLEAISNGVSAFRRPEARHARQVLVVMSCTLAFLVFGVTMIAHWTHAVPYGTGSPTVVSQEVHYVLEGSGLVGTVFFYVVQFATLIVLYTGANTSFNGFPFLANFVAGDSFLPRQLTRRGHRLSFSNGIIVLTIVAVALLVATHSNLAGLVALYAIGVFTGFTMAGAGMVKHHLRERSAHWRRSIIINGFSAFLAGSVVLIFAVAKFWQGAWVVVVLGPLMFWGLIRLHRQYETEESELEVGAAQACAAPILRRHVVVVLVDRLDLATARAIQYARTLSPDDLRAVHFAMDPRESVKLEEDWRRLGLSRLPLDMVECPDRRLVRAALELAAEVVSDGETELTILLPRRGFAAGWGRLLHDRTADRIAAIVGELPHANATIVPFQLARGYRKEPFRRFIPRSAASPGHEHGSKAGGMRDSSGRPGTTPIGEVQWRHRARVAGRVKSVRVQPRAGVPSLECTLVDETGGLLLIFQGRRQIPGIQPGVRLVAEGMVGERDRRLAILNPDYELLAGSESGETTPN